MGGLGSAFRRLTGGGSEETSASTAVSIEQPAELSAALEAAREHVQTFGSTVERTISLVTGFGRALETGAGIIGKAATGVMTSASSATIAGGGSGLSLSSGTGALSLTGTGALSLVGPGSSPIASGGSSLSSGQTWTTQSGSGLIVPGGAGSGAAAGGGGNAPAAGGGGAAATGGGGTMVPAGEPLPPPAYGPRDALSSAAGWAARQFVSRIDPGKVGAESFAVGQMSRRFLDYRTGASTDPLGQYMNDVRSLSTDTGASFDDSYRMTAISGRFGMGTYVPGSGGKTSSGRMGTADQSVQARYSMDTAFNLGADKNTYMSTLETMGRAGAVGSSGQAGGFGQDQKQFAITIAETLASGKLFDRLDEVLQTMGSLTQELQSRGADVNPESIGKAIASANVAGRDSGSARLQEQSAQVLANVSRIVSQQQGSALGMSIFTEQNGTGPNGIGIEDIVKYRKTVEGGDLQAQSELFIKQFQKYGGNLDQLKPGQRMDESSLIALNKLSTDFGLTIQQMEDSLKIASGVATGAGQQRMSAMKQTDEYKKLADTGSSAAVQLYTQMGAATDVDSLNTVINKTLTTMKDRGNTGTATFKELNALESDIQKKIKAGTFSTSDLESAQKQAQAIVAKNEQQTGNEKVAFGEANRLEGFYTSTQNLSTEFDKLGDAMTQFMVTTLNLSQVFANLIGSVNKFFGFLSPSSGSAGAPPPGGPSAVSPAGAVAPGSSSTPRIVYDPTAAAGSRYKYVPPTPPVAPGGGTTAVAPGGGTTAVAPGGSIAPSDGTEHDTSAPGMTWSHWGLGGVVAATATAAKIGWEATKFVGQTAWSGVKQIGSAIRHPISTAKSAGRTIKGAFTAVKSGTRAALGAIKAAAGRAPGVIQTGLKAAGNVLGKIPGAGLVRSGAGLLRGAGRILGAPLAIGLDAYGAVTSSGKIDTDDETGIGWIDDLTKNESKYALAAGAGGAGVGAASGIVTAGVLSAPLAGLGYMIGSGAVHATAFGARLYGKMFGPNKEKHGWGGGDAAAAADAISSPSVTGIDTNSEGVGSLSIQMSYIQDMRVARLIVENQERITDPARLWDTPGPKLDRDYQRSSLSEATRVVTGTEGRVSVNGGASQTTVYSNGQIPVSPQFYSLDSATVPKERQETANRALIAAAAKHGLRPEMLKAIMLGENAPMNASQVTDSGIAAQGPAVGLMQMTTATASGLLGRTVTVDELKDPNFNADVSAQYFAKLLKENGNDPVKALAAYRGGAAGPAYAAKAMERYAALGGPGDTRITNLGLAPVRRKGQTTYGDVNPDINENKPVYAGHAAVITNLWQSKAHASAYGAAGHTGIDLAVDGTGEVVAPERGKLIAGAYGIGSTPGNTSASTNFGYGNSIVIQGQSGAVHRLSHLENLSDEMKRRIDEAKKGNLSDVDMGALLGEIGESGNAHGKHLDWEVYENMEAFKSHKTMDPLEWMRQQTGRVAGGAGPGVGANSAGQSAAKLDITIKVTADKDGNVTAAKVEGPTNVQINFGFGGDSLQTQYSGGSGRNGYYING